MSTFDEREKGFERKFAHDEELKFRATARRNKLLGLWAAEQLGLSGKEGRAILRQGGGQGRSRRARRGGCGPQAPRELDAKGIEQSDHQIRRMMGELMGEAVNQIETETKA